MLHSEIGIQSEYREISSLHFCSVCTPVAELHQFPGRSLGLKSGCLGWCLAEIWSPPIRGAVLALTSEGSPLRLLAMVPGPLGTVRGIPQNRPCSPRSTCSCIPSALPSSVYNPHQQPCRKLDTSIPALVLCVYLPLHI